jgi:hypothetical protein
MATRADIDLIRAIPKTYSVAAGGAVTAGMPVMFGPTDQEIVTSTTPALTFAIAAENGAPGDRVTVYPLAVTFIPVKVGTGGATRGARAKQVATGFTDAADGDITVGHFVQSGVVGDLVGMAPGGAR